MVVREYCSRAQRWATLHLWTASSALRRLCLLTSLDLHLPPQQQNAPWRNSVVRGWFNIYSDGGKNARSWITHTASWSTLVFLGGFPSKLWPDLALLLTKSNNIPAWGRRINWEMLSLPSDTWLAWELGVQNLQTPSPWFCGNVNTTTTVRCTSQLIMVPQRQQDNWPCFLLQQYILQP